MTTAITHRLFPVILCWCSILFIPTIMAAQETDTTKVNIEQDQESDRTINLNQQFERPATGGILTEMGTYQVPSETQYYQRPFKGQEYLDMAVEAYRKEMEQRVGDNWYWQFLKTVSPYIRLELGAFQTMQMQYVDRDNPLFESYRANEKKQ